MQAGKLRNKVLIQRRQQAQDDFGQPSTSWATVAETFADIEPLNGRELILARSAQSEITHNVVIRYRPGITTAMRINYNGRFFNIRAVMDQNERHKILTLQCTEGLNDG